MNERDATVIADVFTVETDAELRPGAEIVWIDPFDPGDIELALLTRDQILPSLSKRAFG